MLKNRKKNTKCLDNFTKQEISTNGPNKSLNNKSNNVMDPAKPLQPISLLEKIDKSGNSSTWPTKVGEGENGSSHGPLPKVVVRVEDVPLKSPKKRPILQNIQLADFREISSGRTNKMG